MLLLHVQCQQVVPYLQIEKRGIMSLIHCITPSNVATSCSMSTGSTISTNREERYNVLDTLYHPQ